MGLLSLLAVFIAYGGVQVYRKLGLTPITLNHLLQLLMLSLIGVLCHILMRSYQRLYQREHELANTRRELLMTLTHELRSPLFAAQGMIQNLLKSHHDLNEKDLQAQLETASTAITTVNREVEGITQLFRVDSGRLQCRPQRVILKAIYDDLRRRHSQTDPRQLILEGEELAVQADPLLLLQALDNLVVNAFRYATAGDVTVRAHQVGDRVEIEVRDQGPGVDPGQRELIFERYHQGRPGSAGFGIGLFLGREYLEAQNGSLELRPDEGGGGGACFVASVPVAEEQDSPARGAISPT